MKVSARPPNRRPKRQNGYWRPSPQVVFVIVAISLLVTLPWLAMSSPVPSASDDSFANYLRAIMASMPDDAIPSPPFALQPSVFPMSQPAMNLFRFANHHPMYLPMVPTDLLTRTVPDDGTRSLTESANYAMNKLGYLAWKSKYASFNLLSAAFQAARAAVGFGAVGFKLNPEKRQKMVRVAAKVLKKLDQRSPGALPRGTDHMKLAKKLIDDSLMMMMKNKKNKGKKTRRKMFTRVEDFSPELQTMLGFPPDHEVEKLRQAADDGEFDDIFSDYEEKPTTTTQAPDDEFDFIIDDEEQTSTPKSNDEEASGDGASSDVFGDQEITFKDHSVSMAYVDDPFMAGQMADSFMSTRD